MANTRNHRAPVVRDAVIAVIANSETRSATSADLPASGGYLNRLVDGGYIEPHGTVKRSAGRGRPSVVYRLTNKGRGRARTLAKAA